MTLTFLIGAFAGVLSAVAWISYIVGIVKKETRPNRATWITLTLVGLLVFLSYYDGGARDTIWVSLAYVLGPLFIALLSIFYYGEGGWTPFDKKCLSFVGVSFLLWIIFRLFYAELALPVLIIGLGIDFVGLLPTIKKSWYEPNFENPTAWFYESMSSILNLFAVGTWLLTLDSFVVWIYPVYLVVVNLIITLILFRSKLGFHSKY